MKFMFGSKDGGPESKVRMYGVESKKLGSMLLLRFAPGSREAYHSHAFNCVSRVLSGELYEDRMFVERRVPVRYVSRFYLPRTGWFRTSRDNLHKVTGTAPVTWVLTLRGPWAATWTEFVPRKGWFTLTHGRKVVS